MMKTLKTEVALLVLLVALPALGQQAPSASPPSDAKPYHMLVIGDSITWGQGLKKEHKAWYQVKVWLEKQTGRQVVERVEAHSGAVIDGGPTREMKIPNDAEVNLGFPSINEEVDNALRFYSDGSRVDLVLLSGCGNDVGTQNFLNAANSEELNRMTEQKCRPLMESLLRKVTNSFPAAQVMRSPILIKTIEVIPMAITSGKRELIDTGTDKRYVKRDKQGRFKEVVDVGRSLAADRRSKSKTVAKPGYGDQVISQSERLKRSLRNRLRRQGKPQKSSVAANADIGATDACHQGRRSVFTCWLVVRAQVGWLPGNLFLPRGPGAIRLKESAISNKAIS